MKAQFLLLCIAVIPVIYAWPYKQCPEIPDNTLRELSYKQIGGDWKLIASKPAFDDKCININIDGYTLKKEYYSKIFFFWRKKSSKEYSIVNEIKPHGLNLKAKAWYSFEKEKLSLFGANYDSFAIFYSCTPGLLHYSETYQLWTRDEVDPKNLPDGLIKRLAVLNVNPEELTFRTAKDCNK